MIRSCLLFVLIDSEADSAAVCKLVHCALKHYNSKNRVGTPNNSGDLAASQFLIFGFDPLGCASCASTGLTQGDFEYPAELTTEMKATGISFRERFWYHVGFLARRRNAGADDEWQHFFAELRFNEWTRRPNVQTCTILGA